MTGGRATSHPAIGCARFHDMPALMAEIAIRDLPGSSGEHPEQRISVWIADDSPLQLEVARRALASKCKVSPYSDGLKLLEDLNSGLSPDVLILDWQMPDLTGLEVCRFVRSSKDLAELPILVLTSKG